MQIVIERATLIAVGDQPKSIPVFTDLPPIRIAGISIGYQIVWIVGSSLLLIGLLVLFFQKTLVGRAMRACAINREAAALQGIPVSRMLALSFALSAALGALAGILLTPTQFTAFNVGTPFAISGFIAAIVGGFGRPLGAFLGGIALGLAQALAVLGLGSGLKNVAALSVLLMLSMGRRSAPDKDSPRRTAGSRRHADQGCAYREPIPAGACIGALDIDMWSTCD